jgi:hypothetical protein
MCESPYERDEAPNKPRRNARGWMLSDESYTMLLGNQRMGAKSAPEPELSDGKKSPAEGGDIRREPTHSDGIGPQTESRLCDNSSSRGQVVKDEGGASAAS